MYEQLELGSEDPRARSHSRAAQASESPRRSRFVGCADMPRSSPARSLTATSQWRPPEADVPAPRLPLTARIERLAQPLRAAIWELAESLDERSVAEMSRWFAAPDQIDDRIGLEFQHERIARVIIGAWLIATLRKEAQGPEFGLSIPEGNFWFWAREISGPDPRTLKEVREALNAHGSGEAEALLPYLLDPFGLTTRIATRRGTGDHGERRARKEVGTFYTPGDVARLLAEDAVDGDGPVFDPACGTGVLLRAAFSRMCCDLAVPPGQALGCLYGMDIDPRAIDACALVLAHDLLARQGGRSGDGGTAWRLARLNLAVADSLSAFSLRKALGTGNDDYPHRRPKNRLDLRGQVLEVVVQRRLVERPADVGHGVVGGADRVRQAGDRAGRRPGVLVRVPGQWVPPCS